MGACVVSASLLREAAAKMRESVSAVRDSRAHCPGEKHGGPNARYSWVFMSHAFAAHAPGDAADPDLKEVWDADAKHLDPWQNLDLTLAVADLLDQTARDWQLVEDGVVWSRSIFFDATKVRALAVARAYLGAT